MNKYMFLMVLVVYLVMMTFVAGSLSMITSTDVIGTIGGNTDATALDIFGFLGTFFKILTFQIEGLPALVTIIGFYPVSLAVLYMIMDIVKDIIPFT